MLFRERMRQVCWVLDHLDDLDADFLAIYRIDLHDPDITIAAPRFLALAFRCFAYRGVMREELLIEHRNNEPAPAPAPAPALAAPAPGGRDADGTRWVSPEQMLAIYNNPELGR